MGVLGRFSNPSSKNVATVKPTFPEPDPAAEVNAVDPSSTAPSETEPSLVSSQTEAPVVPEDSVKPAVTRRISFRPFAPAAKHKPALSEAEEHEKKANAADAFTKRWMKPLSFNSDKRAKESALIVRALIVGPSSNDYAKPRLGKVVARPQLSKVKSELMQPNSANRVIVQLRSLPVTEETAESGQDTGSGPNGPIHAVCLAYPDAEEHELHFSKLHPDMQDESSKLMLNVASAPLDKLAIMFNEMHIVDLISAPDLGFGQAEDGKGLLAGSIPTAATVINGFEQITPQLMALGYATGKAILPDHKGVHPPTDRISVLTYWWGLEIVLPPPSIKYLSNTQSVAGTLVNFLTALSLVNGGARELLPFVRYISQFIDFEFNMIKRQDKGQGVVCASTWIMPAALVPRPWDFTPPERDTVSTKQRADKEQGPGALNQSPFIPDSAASVPLPHTSPLDNPLARQPNTSFSVSTPSPSQSQAALYPAQSPLV
ncbi:hypothetical protein GGX14DRAFT_495499 [Mycena pura]|uniref:Uncharacterized protein n=1 Tax=Mycena pura TaxID=153505 RepID=A0AAD6VPB5_9AGAR|nr:hypothetical protein GGX14DRAFT_495499 [Mycena pura]